MNNYMDRCRYCLLESNNLITIKNLMSVYEGDFVFNSILELIFNKKVNNLKFAFKFVNLFICV